MTAVHVGLFVRIQALDGKEDEVARFLEGALPLALAEPATTEWFAVRLDTSTFAVFDVFPDDDGRDAHLGGPIAKALMESVGTLIAPPTIEKLDVLAAKLSADVEAADADA